ncbi:hypothetical protein [Actinoplanes sp. NPDC026623]|uniref:hypothetical protein n=1 Tax=Actinoplanes sp. NPDC026623 TaxID=3155610 RepID=UPI0033CEFEB0
MHSSGIVCLGGESVVEALDQVGGAGLIAGGVQKVGGLLVQGFSISSVPSASVTSVR